MFIIQRSGWLACHRSASMRASGGRKSCNRNLHRPHARVTPCTQSMSLGDPGGIIVADPDPSVRVLPRQHSHWQINTSRLPILHQRRTAVRVAKNQQLRRTQLKPDASGVRCVVNPRKHRHAFCSHDICQPIDSITD